MSRIVLGVDLSDVYNFNEDLVVLLLDKLLKQNKDICRCRSCLEDMYSLSLKLIEPRYHPNSLIEQVMKGYLERQAEFEVNAEKLVMKAIKVVSGNPHH